MILVIDNLGCYLGWVPPEADPETRMREVPLNFLGSIALVGKWGSEAGKEESNSGILQATQNRLQRIGPSRDFCEIG